jgi:hypothetical protein
VLVSAAFKIPVSENYNNNLYQTGPYGSFVGRICEQVEENENDCKFGVNLLEYNNFSFANKEKINFKIHVVYEAGPDSRFRKLASRLQIGKLIFISGFFDLNENETPFIEAKEIDILNEFSENSPQTQSSSSFQSPFSRTAKFRSNKKSYQSPSQKASKTIEIIDDDEHIDNKSEEEEPKIAVASASTNEIKDLSVSEKLTKKNVNKRKMELADLSIQRLERAAKNTKVKTRSQKRNENQKGDNILTEAEAEEST